MSKAHKPDCKCTPCRLTRIEIDIHNLKVGVAQILGAAEEGARLIKEEEGK